MPCAIFVANDVFCVACCWQCINAHCLICCCVLAWLSHCSWQQDICCWDSWMGVAAVTQVGMSCRCFVAWVDSGLLSWAKEQFMLCAIFVDNYMSCVACCCYCIDAHCLFCCCVLAWCCSLFLAPGHLSLRLLNRCCCGYTSRDEWQMFCYLS